MQFFRVPITIAIERQEYGIVFGNRLGSSMARFEKGQSGNPRGRPRGSSNKMAALMKEALNDDIARLVEVARDAALAGDMRAMKLVFERVWPISKDSPIELSEELPNIATPKDAVDYAATVIRGVSRGEISPSQARDLIDVVEGYIRAFDVADHADRLDALEAELKEISSAVKERRNGKSHSTENT
jgi:hypothetical protein